MAEESNFDSLNVVRITYGELLELAGKLRLDCDERTTSNSDDDGLGGEKTETWCNSDAHSSPTTSIAQDDDRLRSSHHEVEILAGKFGTDSNAENDSDDRRNRNRRPDQRLYVPRHRADSLRQLPQADEETKTEYGYGDSESKTSKRYSKRVPRRTRTVSSSTELSAASFTKDAEFRNGDVTLSKGPSLETGSHVSSSSIKGPSSRRRFCSGDSLTVTSRVISGRPDRGGNLSKKDEPPKKMEESGHVKSRRREKGVGRGKRRDRGGGVVGGGGGDNGRKDVVELHHHPEGHGEVEKTEDEPKCREGRWDSWELSDNQDEDVLSENKTRVFVSSVINWSEEVERELKERVKLPAAQAAFSGSESSSRRERSPTRSRKKRTGRQRRRTSPRHHQGPHPHEENIAVVRKDTPRKEERDRENRGILHLPAQSLQNMQKGEGKQTALQVNVQVNERDTVQKHLFNPDNPDKPLMVTQASTAHHANQQRRAAREMKGYRTVDEVQGSPQGQEYGGMMGQFAGRGFGYPAPIQQQQQQQQVIDGPYKIGPSARIAVVEKNIREAMLQEEELSAHLSQSFDRMDLKRMSQIRWKIQVRYENCILADLEFCSKHNIEQTLWKAAFYQVIEAFRRQTMEVPAYKEEVRTALLSLIDEGVVFYENLLEKLQDTFGFLLAHFLDSDALRPHSSRSEKLAILSSQKVLICLGDLARYQEQANETSHYGKARNWYLKAQQLAPKNGRPYNQLAILALYARRKMDAVYYYMRSLAASNPFVTAKESLIALFDETRKKYEMEERLRSATRPAKVQPLPRAPPTSMRVELWYTPDGRVSKPSCWPEEVEWDISGDNLCDSDSAEAAGARGDLAKLTPLELNKKFVLSFLHVHGKIFSRVGMETFADICVQMLREFRTLLHQGPTALNGHKLLQVVTINMYAIHNTEQKGHSDVDQYECRSLLQTRAVEMSMEMFSLLLERCNMLLNNCQEPLNEELQQHLLPAVKVWCDWLLSDPVVWNPLPSLVDLDISGGKEDCWSRLASFINRIKSLKRQINCQLITEKKEDCEPVVLPEDTALAGFVPLLHMPQVPVFAIAPVDKEKTRLLLRLHRIEYTAEVLCGLDPPVLVFDVGRQCYTAAVVSPQDDHRVTDHNLPHVDLDEDLEDGDEDGGSCGELSNGLDSAAEEDQGSDGGNIRRDLRSRKIHLQKVKANQERHQRQIQEVLQEVSQSRRVKFEVHPRFLVPDTNCFIDHLPDMRTLVKSDKYQLVVPLIVINELDGLARGMKPCLRPLEAGQTGVVPVQESSYSNERAHRVAQVAKEALKFLEDCFNKRLTCVKAVTIKGTFLNSITFRSESVGDYKGSNDDIVLNCCLQLSKNASEDSKVDKGEFTLVWREVVLLTDDRNLRIKAHSHEVPTRGVPRFLKLMHIG